MVTTAFDLYSIVLPLYFTISTFGRNVQHDDPDRAAV